MKDTKKKRVYLDYATTTPVYPRVANAMRPFLTTHFGNPSSLHAEGLFAKKAVDASRKSIAFAIHAHSDEIIFTSGGTEANNLALFGTLSALNKKGREWSTMHVLTSVIEHSSVLECFKEFERRGVFVEYVKVTKEGVVDLSDFEKKIRKETALVSIMYANNEIGTIQPIRALHSILKKKSKALFHVDASQAFLYLNASVDHLGADCVTYDAQKMYGPKGIGFLYVRRGTNISPMFFGGGQERSLRPGTENVPLIVGCAKAVEIALSNREKESKRLRSLSEYARASLTKTIPRSVFNSSEKYGLPHIVNVSIPHLDAEFAVLKLDAEGIACSTKSACMESSEASYVIAALGKGKEYSRGSLRFSFGSKTNKADIDRLCLVLKKILF